MFNLCAVILEMNLPWKEKGKPTNVVVYKKQKTSNKHYMIVTNIHVDVLNNARATKPIIDHKYEIVEMGIGETFIDIWCHKYGIKSPKVLAK
jgi:rRNA maturation protein Rpf1